MKRFRNNPQQRLRFMERDRHRIVCPFPGRNPLRLHYRVFARPTLSEIYVDTVLAEYDGKLVGSAWAAMVRHVNKGLRVDWQLYDRYRCQVIGVDRQISRVPNMGSRYFYGYHLPEGAFIRPDFSTVKRIKVGPYWMYDAGLVERTPYLDQAVIRVIETTIPTLRSVA